jgi:hypothetical protein
MITIYLGAPGSGKSYLMRSHVRVLLAELDKRGSAVVFLIVDHDDSWRTGAQVDELPPDAVGYFTSADAYRELESLPRVAVFRGVPPLEVAALALAIGDAVYVDDEIDHALGDSPWLRSPLREIVKRGRHIRAEDGEVASVSALVATHRAANLPTDVSGLFSRVYVGRLTAWRDAQRVHQEGWIERETVAEVRAELAARPVGTFTFWPPAP